MKLRQDYQALARLAQAMLTRGAQCDRDALEAAVQKALGPKQEPQQQTKADVTVIFDGGNGCNSPRLGYGNGYGSYRINQNPVVRVQFNQPMSNNAAEVATLCEAVQKTITHVGYDQRHIHIIGDSKIALLRCKKAPNPSFKGKPSSPLFLNYCDRLLKLLSNFRKVTTEWQPRAKSVAIFGH